MVEAPFESSLLLELLELLDELLDVEVVEVLVVDACELEASLEFDLAKRSLPVAETIKVPPRSSRSKCHPL